MLSESTHRPWECSRTYWAYRSEYGDWKPKDNLLVPRARLLARCLPVYNSPHLLLLRVIRRRGAEL
jgi:hypothetical protein